MENKLMDNLPTYDGKEAFDGYLTEFEAIYKVCGGDYDLQFSYLHTHLKGAARLWLHDQPSWSNWTYEKLVQALKDQYSEVITDSQTRLEQLQFRDDLYKFNT